VLRWAAPPEEAPVPELILHHYDISPYAEKIRLAFGLKDLPWRSVRIPVVMPKPDLVELTGGYRRTPTLQVGADIYCDTKAIARALERLQPTPSLYPPGTEAVLPALSRWAETSFMMVVTILFGLDVFDESFVEDRRKMLPGVDFSQAKRLVPAKWLQLQANLDLLERQLADGRSFLLGAAPSLADLAAYHPLMGVGVHATLRPLLDGLPRLRAWSARVSAIGHGKREEMEAAEAIAVARDASPAPFAGEPAPLPEGLRYGDPVAVLPEEPGSGVVSGELLPSGLHEIRVRRRGERAGELVVHLPREDYLVVRTG
jgi:glutathione S-transferase